ncbi:beta-ketoacyl synthase N-terminal-like domain-containing protein [Burkholderia sp. Ac-20379]|uniref:beta-ketoacyl synthase N-terminal-like domain-containing protein n=1 Tax=Burkholderia sp. Ac-20379 TaxID=2703900 RepID=UPI001981F226|nr:beta-ketoacyl synthase N-terminal-like domain-containing protein [Burkholderia sp. Ac-20379]MBN3725610.1 polyketide beta-ketoacyl:ACP synthase [Burkholderia sp. Ac-20379]
MPCSRPEPAAPVVTGIGVASALGYGKQAFLQGLLAAPSVFGAMRRPGRGDAGQAFIGAELPESPQPPPALDRLPPRIARTTGLSGQVAVGVLDEAWREAGLDALDPQEIGLVIGGSNLQAREQMLLYQAHAARPAFVPPRYGYGMFDTDLSGLCTSLFPIAGFAYSVGGASASGLLAVQHALDAVRSGRVRACIALGALQDLSHYECQALRSAGAMGSDRFADQPGEACRPFDAARDGFIFGEASAALVVRRAEDLSDPAVAAGSYGSLIGAAQVANGSRGTAPSLDGELRAIRMALAQAGLTADRIDYVNAHATGTPLGDDTELAAYRQAGLTAARVNATKSIVGHGLSAAGAIELAATLLQMRAGMLHPTRNLTQPIADDIRWVGAAAEPHTMRYALKLSFGFGGIDTALVVRAPSLSEEH